ncbi:MAG: MGT family glycosyltransferase, partial [Myxococcota bacterium]
DRPDNTESPWDRLKTDKQRVLVSLGTVNADRGARFYRAVVSALGGTDRVVVLAAPPEVVGDVPDNIIVRGWIPQLKLLSHVDAVVTHGGHNTVCEALSHGLPLVVAPIKDDQPVVAAQVEACGAGVRVRFGRIRPQALGAAVDTVLGIADYRIQAQRIAASFKAAGGATAAADVLEELT